MKNYNKILLLLSLILILAIAGFGCFDYYRCYKKFDTFKWSHDHSAVYEQEGLSTDFCGQLQNERLRYVDSLTKKDSNIYHIPHELHYIWLTDPINPREMGDKYKNTINNTIKNLYSNNSNWNVNLWINVSNDKIPKTLNYFKKLTPNLKLRNVSELDFGKLKKNYQDFNTKKQYAPASDIARYNILKQFGGVYIDLDYKLYKPLEFVIDKFDFVAGLEEKKQMLIGNAFISAKKEHPIILEAIDVADRNLNHKEKAPKYVLFPKNEFSRIIVSVGPRIMVPAIYKKINLGSNKDYIASHGIFYDHPDIKDGKKIYSECNTIDFEILGKIGHDPLSATWRTRKLKKRICYKDHIE